jgi:deoxyribonuclease IV
MENKVDRKWYLGAHLSIAKGFDHAVYEARSLGCNALQIFTKNASAWKEREISDPEILRFHQAKHETGIEIIVSHTSYLINLASADPEMRKKSIQALKAEMRRAGQLDLSYVVIHPGAHKGAGVKQGLDRIAESLDIVFDQLTPPIPLLLLETTAGQGSSLGSCFDQLSTIMENVFKSENLGVCMDTSHIFAAGYDIRTDESYDHTMNAFSSTIGFQHLHLFHLNDSKKEIGSRIDRHEHIGKGFIGIDAFKRIMNDSRFINVPKIIETPKENNMDHVNLNLLKMIMNELHEL